VIVSQCDTFMDDRLVTHVTLSQISMLCVIDHSIYRRRLFINLFLIKSGSKSNSKALADYFIVSRRQKGYALARSKWQIVYLDALHE
jgi:hypothetical protein